MFRVLFGSQRKMEDAVEELAAPAKQAEREYWQTIQQWALDVADAELDVREAQRALDEDEDS
jgi:hypothetical protein